MHGAAILTNGTTTTYSFDICAWNNPMCEEMEDDGSG